MIILELSLLLSCLEIQVRSHGVWSVTRAGGYLHVVGSALHVLRLSHLPGIPPSQHYKAAPHSNHQYLYKHELNSSHLTTLSPEQGLGISNTVKLFS